MAGLVTCDLEVCFGLVLDDCQLEKTFICVQRS